MSLFYSPREVRLITSKKRKKETADVKTDDHETYSCQWCDDEYDSETELHVHKRARHNMNVRELLSQETVCKVCISAHEDKDQLIQHVKSAHLLSSNDAEHVHREIFICDICHEIYFNKQMMAIHMQNIHDRQNRHKLSSSCPKCNKTVQIRHVWFHFQRHLIQSVACCQICLLKCKNLKDLNEHLKLHPYYYHCDICSYKSKVKDSFSMHMQGHNSNLQTSRNIAIDEKILRKCFIPRKLPQKSDNNFGLRGLRLPELHICVLCRGICKEEERAAHIAKYHLVNLVTTKKQYMCVCGEEFFNNVLLKHHVFKLKGMHQACDS